MKAEILDALRALQPELSLRGVAHAGLFGSVARDEHGPDSDIDILVDIDRDSRMDLFAYVGLQRYIRVLLKRRFRRKVDVVSLGGLNRYIRPAVERDVVYAF